MKRWILRIVLRGVAIVLFLVVALWLVGPLCRGWSLRHKLNSAIDYATTIKVVEHSDRTDREFDSQVPYKEKIYRTVMLTEDQVAGLKKALPLSRDYSFEIEQFCIFVPHHRVEFQNKAGNTVVLEICFHCGELTLDGDIPRILPNGWQSALRTFIVAIGLNPDRGEDQRETVPPKRNVRP